MSFFSNTHEVKSSVLTESFADIENAAIEEGFEYTGMDFDEMAIGHVAESEENYNKIMMAIGIHEATEFAETGTPVAYTEGVLSDIKDKIVSFIKAVWGKIVALFKRFIAMIDVWTKDDKEFLNKYKEQLVKRVGKLKDFSFKGYKFTNLNNFKAAIDELQNKASEEKEAASKATELEKAEEKEEKFDDEIEAVRGEILKALDNSANGSFTASEFTKELFMVFRDGESSKVTIDNVDINAIMNELATAKQTKKDAKTAFDNAKKACDGFVKDVESLNKTAIKDIPGKNQTETEKAANKSRALNYYARRIRAYLAIMQAVNGAHLTALKDRSRQNKAVCVKIINSVKAESTGVWEHEIEEGASFLANVTLR